jgi:hypothetical protein
MKSSQTYSWMIFAVLVTLGACGPVNLSIPRPNEDETPSPPPLVNVSFPDESTSPPPAPAPQPSGVAPVKAGFCPALAGHYGTNELEDDVTQTGCTAVKWVRKCALPEPRCREHGLPLSETREFIADNVERQVDYPEGFRIVTRSYYQEDSLWAEVTRIGATGTTTHLRERFFRTKSPCKLLNPFGTLYLVHEIYAEGDPKPVVCDMTAPFQSPL